MSTKTKNKSNFGGLSNDELLFIFFIIKDVLNTYEEIISQEGVSNRLLYLTVVFWSLLKV